MAAWQLTVNIDWGVKGGGVIQTTASESTFVCLLAGRTEAIKRCQVGRGSNALYCTVPLDPVPGHGGRGDQLKAGRLLLGPGKLRDV